MLNNLVELPPPSAEHHQRRSYALSQGDDDSCGIRFTAPNADPLDTNSLQVLQIIIHTLKHVTRIIYTGWYAIFCSKGSLVVILKLLFRNS